MMVLHSNNYYKSYNLDAFLDILLAVILEFLSIRPRKELELPSLRGHPRCLPTHFYSYTSTPVSSYL